MNLNETIQFHLQALSKSDRVIYDELASHTEMVVNHNIRALSTKLNTNPAKITRLTQKLGFKGYPEFRLEWIKYYQSGNQNMDNTDSLVEQVCLTQNDIVSLLGKVIDEHDINQLVTLIQNSQHIYAVGNYRSFLAATMFKMKMIELGVHVDLVDRDTLYYGGGDFAKENDLVIFFSSKLKNEYVARAINVSHDNKAKNVIITMSEQPKIRNKSLLYFKLPFNASSTNHLLLEPATIQFIVIDIIVSYYTRGLSYLSNKE